MKPEPRWICVMTEAQVRRFDSITINHRCTSTDHWHWKKAKVEALVESGDMQWVGMHRKVAKVIRERSWQKTMCKGFGPTMQLVRGIARQ